MTHTLLRRGYFLVCPLSMQIFNKKPHHTHAVEILKHWS